MYIILSGQLHLWYIQLSPLFLQCCSLLNTIKRETGVNACTLKLNCWPVWHSLVKNAEVWQQYMPTLGSTIFGCKLDPWQGAEWHSVLVNGQDIAASSWYPYPSCEGSCMFAELVVISSQHFSPKSSEIVCKATIVSFLLMRSLVHSSWHCSQANYADSLGVGNSAATLPITKCAKLWGTLWQLVHSPMYPCCNTRGIHRFDVGEWSMNL